MTFDRSKDPKAEKPKAAAHGMAGQSLGTALTQAARSAEVGVPPPPPGGEPYAPGGMWLEAMTGGACTALTLRSTSGYHVLLTEYGELNSPESAEQHSWMGLYDEEGQCILDPEPMFEGSAEACAREGEAVIAFVRGFEDADGHLLVAKEELTGKLDAFLEERGWNIPDHYHAVDVQGDGAAATMTPHATRAVEIPPPPVQVEQPELPMPAFQLASPVINTTFDISTGHVEQRDMELLQIAGGGNPFASVYPYEAGVLVVVNREHPVDPKGLESFGYSPALVEVYLQAQHLGAKFINLDRDGAQYDELPSFDW